MNSEATLITGTVLIVYVTVSLFCVYMGANKPHAPARERSERHGDTEPLKITLINRVKEFEYRKIEAKWENYDIRLTNMDGGFYSSEGDDSVQYFNGERVKRIKAKLYNEILKGRSNSLKIVPSVSENDSFVPQNRVRKRAHFSKSTPSRQSNAYYQLIHLITMPNSRSISGDATLNPPPLHPSRSSFTTSCPTSVKCSYNAHASSASCIKSTKHCVEFPIALKTDLQLLTHQEDRGYLYVKRGGNLVDVNEKLITSGCPDVYWGPVTTMTGRGEWEASELERKVKKNINTNARRESWSSKRAKAGDDEEEEQEEVDNDNEDTRISLTIDARCSFLQEVNALHLPRRLSLDLIFDLAGLNSLHKHEIIASLYRVLVRLLLGNGYHLVGSSAKGTDLMQYLQQESLQQPLFVHTLWQCPDCISYCT